MSAYRRPDVEIATFLDDEGRPVPYGTLLGDPPEEAYSRCTHPERFVPVVVVARALAEHLVATYDVRRDDAVVAGRPTTTLTPAGGGAVLRLRIDGGPLPNVELAAGHRFEESWPDCGCDACDDDVLDLLDHLEATVQSIVGGGLSEWRDAPARDGRAPWTIHHRLDGPADTEGASWNHKAPFPTELPDEPQRWPAWRVRS